MISRSASERVAITENTCKSRCSPPLNLPGRDFASNILLLSPRRGSHLNDLLCRVSFAVTGLYCGIFWAEKSTFKAIGGFAEKKAMEDAATAKALKVYGKRQGKKYTVLRKNVLINSTRKYDDMGDWLYLKLIFANYGTFIKAAFGDRSGLDRMLDKLFYDYSGLCGQLSVSDDAERED